MNKEKKYKKLSRQQLRVLHNICLKLRANVHIHGGAAHGAFGQTMQSLERRNLISTRGFRDLTDPNDPRSEPTKDGVIAHRAFCCKRGLTEDDMLVKEVEKKLIGEFKPEGGVEM
jgi:hypothetical protein